MVLCPSLNAGWVVGTFRGGGDTQILPAVIKFVWTFCCQRQWRYKNIFLEPAHSRLLMSDTRATLWNFQYLIFIILPEFMFQFYHFILFIIWSKILATPWRTIWTFSRSQNSDLPQSMRNYTLKQKWPINTFIWK